MQSRTLYFDNRQSGHNAIARFSREYRSRTRLKFTNLPVLGNPSSPIDLFRPGRMRVRPHDLIYTPSFNAGFARCPQLITLHDLIHLGGDSSPTSKLHRLYYEKVAEPAIVQCGSVITVCETSAVAIREWLSRPGIDVVVVGNGASDIFAPPETAPEQTEERKFVYVGTVRPHKNVDRILKAMVFIPGARLVAVTSDRAELAKRANEFGIQDRVEIRTGLPDAALVRLFHHSAALLFPSTVEGFGLPALEALSSGCPVIHLAECASVAEIGRSFGSGTIGIGNTTEAWVAAMTQLRSTRPIVSNRPDKYRWEVVAERLDDQISHQARR